MVDWWGLFYNSLWVLGLAVCLAALSMASYRARTERARLRHQLNSLGFLLPLHLGLVLFCMGLLLSPQSWWARVAWGLLAVLNAGQAIRLWQQARVADVLPDQPGEPSTTESSFESDSVQ